MADKKTLIQLRTEMKKRKPNFYRKDHHKKPKLGKKWRKPKGLQNKMRKSLKGHRKCVSSGYSSPAAVKGLHISGLTIIKTRDVTLNNVDAKTQCIEIPSSLGTKKSVELVKEAMKKKILITNLKDPSAFLKKIEEEMKKRKEEKKGRTEEKKKTKEELKKKAAEKEKKEKKDAEKPMTEEEKLKEQEEIKEAERLETEKALLQGD